MVLPERCQIERVANGKTTVEIKEIKSMAISKQDQISNAHKQLD